jgi:hypothetical protein
MPLDPCGCSPDIKVRGIARDELPERIRNNKILGITFTYNVETIMVRREWFRNISALAFLSQTPSRNGPPAVSR